MSIKPSDVAKRAAEEEFERIAKKKDFPGGLDSKNLKWSCRMYFTMGFLAGWVWLKDNAGGVCTCDQKKECPVHHEYNPANEIY
jgi:hypothetical protein